MSTAVCDASCEADGHVFHPSPKVASRLVLVCLKPLDVRIVRLTEEILDLGTLCVMMYIVCLDNALSSMAF